MILSIGRCTIGAVALGLAYFKTKPVPTAYARAEVCTGHRSDPVDPLAVIKVANVGWGPMYVHELHIRKKGQRCDLQECLKPDTNHQFVITSSSSSLLGKRDPFPRGFAQKGKIPIVTVRPKDDIAALGQQWCDDLFQVLREREIEVEVVSSAFKLFPRSTRIPLYTQYKDVK